MRLILPTRNILTKTNFPSSSFRLPRYRDVNDYSVSRVRRSASYQSSRRIPLLGPPKGPCSGEVRLWFRSSILILNRSDRLEVREVGIGGYGRIVTVSGPEMSFTLTGRV